MFSVVFTLVLSSYCILTHVTQGVLHVSASLLRAEPESMCALAPGFLLITATPGTSSCWVCVRTVEHNRGNKKSHKGFRESHQIKVHQNFARNCEQKHKLRQKKRKRSQISASKSANTGQEREEERERGKGP